VTPTMADPSPMPVTCLTPTAAASASVSRARGSKKGARGSKKGARGSKKGARRSKKGARGVSPADWRSSHPLGNGPGGIRRARGLQLTRARMLQLNGACSCLGFRV